MTAAERTTWTCPTCRRTFRQSNQRHSCGTGDRKAMLRGKTQALVDLYGRLEEILHALPGVEIVAKDRYALFRTTRIFADLTFMKDTLRLAIHLRRQVADPLFFKVVVDGKGQVTHVAKLCSASDVQAVAAYVRQAHRFA